MSEAVRLYVGHDCGSLQGRPFALTGPRMFNRSYGPLSRLAPADVPLVEGWCDSGAFQDPPDRRLTPEGALAGQLAWEARASDLWGTPYRHAAVVSYDLLIDEKWAGGKRRKERWSVAEADAAVRVTVDAAAYLASQRDRLSPRRLVMACQGVDAAQYAECAAGVLAHCRPGDVFGLGGWCILGKRPAWLPAFWAAMRRALPLVAAAGLARVHLFGVMWRVALGGLVWLADRHGLAVSTDSGKAAEDCTYTDHEAARRAGRVRERWEDNVAWWKDALAGLRGSRHYAEPPAGAGAAASGLRAAERGMWD